MVTKIEPSNHPVGNHPDAAPDNTIQRNTAAIGSLVQTVAKHEKTMIEMSEKVVEQMSEMSEHRQIMESHFEETKRSIDSVTELVGEMKALNASVSTLMEVLKDHIPALNENTEAIKKFRL